MLKHQETPTQASERQGEAKKSKERPKIVQEEEACRWSKTVPQEFEQEEKTTYEGKASTSDTYEKMESWLF